MEIRKINRLLNLWEKNNLITNEQNKNISRFMKQRVKENFFRFLKWIAIIGSLWIVFGAVLLILDILKTNFIQMILNYIASVCEFIVIHVFMPIYKLLYDKFGENCWYFLYGLVSFILFIIFHCLSNRYKTSTNANANDITLSDEQAYILKTNYVLDTFAAVSLAAVFCFFNMLLIPFDSFYSQDKIIPLWNILGAVTFIFLAYKYEKTLYLLFGIYFVALSSGLFAGYGFATYWICASRPVIEIAVALFILLIGHMTEFEYGSDKYIYEKFAATYYWTGLLMLFIALWVTSLWGFSVDSPADIEIWAANIIFIAAAIASMYYGAKNENNIFFNYGLTFLIIETYTVFCSRLWHYMSVGCASLLLGTMLLITCKILKEIYYKNSLGLINKQNPVDKPPMD